MRQRLFFRFDAAPEVGLGHARRCAVLAGACRDLGAEIHCLVRRRGVNMEAVGDWSGAVIHEVSWELPPAEDAEWTVQRCRENGLQIGVLDHYRVDADYQQELEGGGLKWLQFGNTGHQHPLLGKWVHDANPMACREDFLTRLLDPQTHCLLGPSYALVGETFSEVRAQAGIPQSRSVESVLLTFGGGDDRGAFERALGWLDAVGFEGRRILLTTGLNPALGRLRRRAAGDGLMELHVDNWQPAQLMAGCQLAVTAGGTALYELACLGVPAVIACTAANQWATALAWQERGLAVSLGVLESEEKLGGGGWTGAERVAAALLAGGAAES